MSKDVAGNSPTKATESTANTQDGDLHSQSPKPLTTKGKRKKVQQKGKKATKLTPEKMSAAAEAKKIAKGVSKTHSTIYKHAN